MIEKNNKIDFKNIQSPNVDFTKTAFEQLKLIIENDFTLAGKYFRILISGKGCDGFTYAAGFTDLMDDDFIVNIGGNSNNTDLQIIIDPFAAFYLNRVSVDYQFHPLANEEGFIITNLKQDEYKGKFFNREDASLPPLNLN